MAKRAENQAASEDPAKREAILDAAIATFARLGFRGTDVQLVADRAGVGKGTVYRYFHCKEDLFWATTYEVLLRMERQLFAAMERVASPHVKLRAAALAYSSFFTDNPSYFELFLQDLAEFRGSGPAAHREHNNKMVERFGEILQQGIDCGEFRAVDKQKTTLAFGSVLFGANVLGCRLQPMPVPEMTEYAVDLLLQGIATETCGKPGVFASCSAKVGETVSRSNG